MVRKVIAYIKYPVLIAVIVLCLVGIVQAATGNVDVMDKWAWGTNAGWINFRPEHGGVTVYSDHLEGYAWGENIGWIRLGSYDGGGIHSYANTTQDNYGVNRDAAGNLSGYAWGTDVGWINFNPTHGGVTIDLATGSFDGYAWAENVGWIHFKGTAPAYNVVTTFLDTDGDGAPDDVEGSGDRDGDGIPNNEDYDPTGYFYEETTGQIIAGGQIAVSGPGVVTIVHDGSGGFYQFTTDGTAGTYTIQATLPPGYGWSNTCLRQDPPPFDPTGGPNPTVLGNGEDGTTGFLTSSDCTAYYLSFDLEAQDPFIFNNNFPIGELFTLTVNATGGGTGTVTSDPSGISCGGDCTEDYVENTVVTLRAHPGVKSYLVGWSGDCDANGQVTMDADKSCTATFGTPVGGIVVPVDKVGLVLPWMGLAALFSLAALTIAVVRRRKP